jgi:elongation factor 2
MTKEQLVEKLWGENYYHVKSNTWHETPGPGRKRGFIQFVMEPLLSMMETLKPNAFDQSKNSLANKQEVLKKVATFNGKVDNDWWTQPDDLFKMVMMQYIPLADALLGMIITHLPSPVKAQQYRVDHLYTGPKDDVYYNAIKNCDPNGPLMMYVSKLFPTPDLSRFFAFGRVFSGTISASPVTIQRPEYVVGRSEGSSACRVQRTSIWMGKTEETVDDCPAGNTIALTGVDKYIIKTATITGEGVKDAHNIKDMKFTVSPVVSVAVTCKNPSELPDFVKGLKLLAKSDPLCVIKLDEDTGQTVISGAGELHLEICINDLRGMFAKGIEIIESDPVVPYRETILERSKQICLAKSSNHHNRLFAIAEPLPDDLVQALEDKVVHDRLEKKELVNKLADLGVPKNEGLKLWKIGEEYPSNLLIDGTKGIQYLNEIKDSCVSGMSKMLSSGPLCQEPCRGVKFALQDVTLHADNIHRGGGQIIPAMEQVCFASMLSAEPRLMEPIYLCEITCPEEMAGSIYGIVNQRRGEVFDESRSDNMATIKVHLPVAESIGFTEFLRSQTGGKAFPQCSFSHWAIIASDPLEEGTKAHEIVKAVRKRKGLKEELPKFEDFNDKM